MKTLNKMITYSILAILTLGTLNAEDTFLPVIKAPDAVLEGTERALTNDQINEILPWAKNSKLFLIDLLRATANSQMEDKALRLRNGIQKQVLESAPKHSELLMRYVLNRGIVSYDILSEETDPNAVGSIDAKVRVLEQSIMMALKYYQHDLDYLTKSENYEEVPFHKFGINYSSFLSELSKSVFDASAQYSLLKLSLEFLQWDLYRDLNNKKFAVDIVKINNSLKTYPDTSYASDKNFISYIRELKGIYNGLSLDGNAYSIPVDNSTSFDSGSHYSNASNRSELQAEELKLYRGMLKNSSYVARSKSINQLKDLPGDDITTILISALLDNHSTVTKAAFDAVLGRSLTKNHINQLQADIYKKSTSYVVRTYVTFIYQKTNIAENLVNDFLIQCLRDSHSTVSDSAFDILKMRNIKNSNLPELQLSFFASSYVIRTKVAFLLMNIKTLESFKLLAKRMGTESHSTVIDQIEASMIQVKKHIRRN